MTGIGAVLGVPVAVVSTGLVPFAGLGEPRHAGAVPLAIAIALDVDHPSCQRSIGSREIKS